MHPVSARSHASSGFTLIEVLVSSVVLVVGVVGMLGIFPQAYRDTTNSGRSSVLNHLAAERIEQLRSLPYDDSDLTAGIHPSQLIDSTGQAYYPVPGFDEEYSLRWTVLAGPTDGAGNPEPDIKTIVVEATYLIRYTLLGVPFERGDSLEVVMSTFVADD